MPVYVGWMCCADVRAGQRLAGVEAEDLAPSVCAPAEIPGEALTPKSAVCGVYDVLTPFMQAIAQSESLTDIVRRLRVHTIAGCGWAAR